MEDKSGVNTPSISLPKGGGAVKGIGETFQPNLFTGTGNFSIPIATSPGREGFGPQLTLQYSTGNGNGPFGLGWQLSIPRITRKTEKGLPTYTDEDVFVMSGAEDLVPFLERVTEDGQEHWKPKSYPSQDGAYTITRYRPRTEGLFARIEKWEQDGDVHWRAITKENVTSVYGRTKAARIVDPKTVGNPAKELKVFEWLLEETFDAKGNHILYEYVKDKADLHIPEIYEQNRQYAQLYIRRILYGNTPDGLSANKQVGPVRDTADHSDPNPPKTRHYVFEVLFDYGDLPNLPGIRHDWPLVAEEIADEKWPLREDPFSNFRAGFELRTLRRCRRVLMLHHFNEGELDGAPLVKSTDFEYENNKDTCLSLLTTVTVRYYQKDPDPQNANTYIFRDMPPVSFKYSQFKPQEQCYQSITANGNDLPPQALNNPNFTLMDLYGNGLPDILNTTASGYYYWENLGKAGIDRRHPQHMMPAGVVLADANVAIGDMGGDGLPDLVVEGPAMSGFYEATPDGSWKPFKRFDRLPGFGLSDPNLRLVDLTGDGLSDALATRDHHFLWYPCQGEAGYGDPTVVERRRDLDDFPDVYFNDPTGRVRLADMTGDGLNDIVLVHDGRIDYWPNRGYGRWGKRITMKDTPRVGYRFDPRRLFLADLDGTGCADMVYVDSGRVHFWFNQSGNGWSKKQTINGMPPVTDVTAIQFADFLGTGTATLMWSDDYSAQPGGNYKVLDFCGGVKPHLLIEMDNNMGATTRVQYASSTKFYLEDKKNGTPWVTNLPFPVQVLEKTEVIDHISKTKLVTTYKYHHGYYDGREREFRGFGRVDQCDTEDFETFAESSLHSSDGLFDNKQQAYHVPPVLTKTWFHTGVYFDTNLPSASGVFYDDEDMMAAYRQEFYHGDDTAFHLDAHEIELADTPHEAYRALRGSLIRSETYALDGTEQARHPYSVVENRYYVQRVQAKGVNNHAVYLTTQLESLTYHYERNPDDPRIAHQLTVQTDDYGNITQSASIAYPRRSAVARAQATSGLSEDAARASKLQQLLAQQQGRCFITFTENDYVLPIGEDGRAPYRHSTLCETRVHELTGLPRPADGLYTGAEIVGAFGQAKEIAYEAQPSGRKPQKRLVDQKRVLFWKDDLSDALPLKGIRARGLPHKTFQLAFPGTPHHNGRTLLQSIFEGDVTDAMLQEGGYYRSDGRYWPADGHLWLPSSTTIFDPNQFYLASAQRDPFGQPTWVSYDVYALLPTAVTDPLGNATRVQDEHGQPRYNYRLLQPEALKDPNDNVTELLFDTRGMVIATAVKGKGQQGDSLNGLVPEPAINQLQDPVAHEQTLLGTATTRIIYDLTASPVFTHRLSRETHEAELSGGQKTRVLHNRVYSDGFGREVQLKALAEPGPIPQRDAHTGRIQVKNGQPQMTGTASPRWTTSGWTIFNNKGKPVQQYEPFFSDRLEFEFDVRLGVTSTLFYDPVERVIATLHPNGTYEKVVFTPWDQATWDANDTVLMLPQQDPDIQGYVSTFTGNYLHPLDGQPFVSWYDKRIPDRNNLPSPNAQSTNPEQRAALKAAAHADTPTIAYFDSLGRPFLTVADNKTEKLATLVELDIEGNDLHITDPRMLDGYLQWLVDNAADADWQHGKQQGWHRNFRHLFDVAGRRLRVISADAGDKRTFLDVLGQPLYTWDGNGHQIHLTYDELRRPTELWVRSPDRQTGALGSYALAEKTIYGEKAADPLRSNLNGQIWKVYDGAGQIINEAYDFKNNLRRVTRRLLADGKDIEPRWPVDNNGNFDEVQSQRPTKLETTPYTAVTEYDALNRVIRNETPDDTVQEPHYNEANLLEKLTVTHAGPPKDYVTNVEYNARGQRTYIQYGNGVTTEYDYDPETFRLTRIVSYRHGQSKDKPDLQDLKYTYDPVGNITSIRDDAHQVVFNRNNGIEPESRYTYDPLYRLVEAVGREHEAMTPCHYQQGDKKQTEFIALTNQPMTNGQALCNYTQSFKYDKGGNIELIQHHNRTTGQRWSRQQTYEGDSNRIRTSRATPERCTYEGYLFRHDANGNIERLSHLPEMRWDFRNQLIAVQLNYATQPSNANWAYYQYDAGGQRVRKTVVKNGRTEERIYLGGYEIYTVTNSSGPTLRRDTIRVMDDKERIALIEDEKDPDVPAKILGSPRTRYQLANHLGSAILEVDGSQVAQIISYEEYYPYGGTAYLAAENETKAKRKRYRYSGKERDDETGLYYYGARYYAPWLGRWMATDPAGFVDRLNLYCFVRSNPIIRIDNEGLSSNPPKEPTQSDSNWVEQTIDFSQLASDIDYQFVERRGRRLNFNAQWQDFGEEVVSRVRGHVIVEYLYPRSSGGYEFTDPFSTGIRGYAYKESDIIKLPVLDIDYLVNKDPGLPGPIAWKGQIYGAGLVHGAPLIGFGENAAQALGKVLLPPIPYVHGEPGALSIEASQRLGFANAKYQLKISENLNPTKSYRLRLGLSKSFSTTSSFPYKGVLYLGKKPRDPGISLVLQPHLCNWRF